MYELKVPKSYKFLSEETTLTEQNSTIQRQNKQQRPKYLVDSGYRSDVTD